MTETVRDRRRIIAAAAVALALHGVLFLLFPRVGLPADHTFEAPLYVAFDPVQPEEPEPAPDVPDTVTDPPVVEPEPDPEPEPEPVDTLAATAPDTPTPPRDTPSPAPSRDTPTPERAEAAPAPNPPAEPAPSAASPGPADNTAPALEGTVEPAPPPLPPRERAFDPAGLEPTTPDAAAVQAAEQRRIAEIAEIQEELAEWEKRQEESAQALSSGSDATAEESVDEISPDQVPRLQNQLRELIDGIRNADNVVSADASRTDDPDGPTDSATDTDEPGSGNVTIEGAGGGTRRLVSGGSVDVSSVSLPGSFPPTYLAEVRFLVRPDGSVSRPSVVPPSTVPELDRVLEETVGSWRFEPATGSSDVAGSVRILIDSTD